jgi:uncharacterized protein Usg
MGGWIPLLVEWSTDCSGLFLYYSSRRRVRVPLQAFLLQSYVWQEYDLFPNFPSLKRFLDFWEKKLDGALHSVTVAHSRLIQPAEIRSVDGGFRLH